MSTTNVPAIAWTNGQPIVPSEQDVLAGRAADFVSAFGGGLNTAPTTPQGQLIASETAIIGDANSQIAYVASMVNPPQSEGAWQDALGAIYFLERIAASGSVATCTCTGAVNVVIPAGALIQDSQGYLWAATGALTIGSGGTVSGTFQCQTQGPIAAPANTINTIYSSVAGWDRVTNPSAAVPGRLVESAAQFENRRRESVAINAHGSVQSIRSNLLAVSGVLSAYVIDNPTGSAITVGSTNYSVAAHSVLASVYGGTSADVATAIWTAKDAGCAYNGNTSYTVYDTSYPAGSQPSYTVTWLTPTETALAVSVTLTNNAQLPADILTSVQDAILATFSGTDGSVPAGIASAISASRYYSGINGISPLVDIVSVNIGIPTAVTNESVGTGNGSTTAFVHTAANLPVNPGSVSITAGSVVATDSASTPVLSGTSTTGTLSGTGVTGTINYTTGAISLTYSTAPANSTAITMDYSYVPAATVATMGVDQMPTLAAENIVLALQ